MRTSFADRLDYLTLAACPVCGKDARLFLRLGNELVCRDHFKRGSRGRIGTPPAQPRGDGK